MKYYFERTFNSDFNTVVQRTKESLTAQGFGVLTEIDIREKLKEKLDVDFRKYLILGACNPAYAHKALLQEDKIGTMLPCNVIIHEIDNNQIEVAAIDPIASMMAIENPNLHNIAIEIQTKLKTVINSITL